LNTLRCAFAVMKNDLYINLATPSSAIMAILIPINFLILFALFALGGSTVPVTAYQADSGQYSSAMVQALDSTHTFRITHVGTAGAGDKAIQHETSVASILIPPGFTDSVKKGDAIQIPVKINNLNDDFASDIRRGLPLSVLNFYKKVMPSALPLDWHEVDSYSFDTSMLDYLAVGIQTVALLLGGIILSGRAVAGEWERGTIKELKLAPVSNLAIILGKIGTGFITGLISALLVLSALLLMGVRPGAWGEFIGVLVLTLFVFVCIGLAIGSFVKSQFVIYPLTLSVALPLFFLSGAFGPISWGSAMGAWIARLFPVVYINAAFQHSIHGYWPIDVSGFTLWLIVGIWAIGSLIIGGFVFSRTAAAH
jgi:ABC-2 type transport system permease protein